MRRILWSLMLSGLGCSSPVDETGQDSTSTAPTYDLATSVMSDGGTFWVSYVPDPDPIVPAEIFSITLSVAEPDGSTPAEDLETVVVDATMPEHNHGMNVLPEVTVNADGTFTAAPLSFHMTGHWEITAAITRAGVEDIARFHVDCCAY